MSHRSKALFGLFAVLALTRPLAAQPAAAPTTIQEDEAIVNLKCQSGWQAYPANPCIAFGDLRPLGSWNDPCVVRDGSRLVMYLSSALRVPGSPPVQPFRAVSDNGTDWQLDPQTPLLAPGGDSEEFDAQSVETPSVVRFGDQYHMYYTGVSRGLSGPMAIGHATSADGISWTKDPHNPVLRPSGNPQDLNGLQVAEPGAVVVGDKVYVYVTAVGLRAGGNPPAKRVIALAQSRDGSSFTPLRAVLEQSDCYPAQLGFDGYSTPSAAYDGQRVHLFYDVGYFSAAAERKWTQVAIHHAVSPDGVTDWRQDADPIITRQSFPWARMEVRAPTALFEGETVRVWFAGNNWPQDFLEEVKSTRKTKQFGIGLLTRAAADVK